MKITERRIRYIAVSLILMCFTPLCQKGVLLNGASVEENVFAGNEITCVIDLGDDMKGSHGLEAGLSYELLGRFAADNDCTIRIISGEECRNANFTDSLKMGKIDILITHTHESEEIGDINLSHPINGCTSWVTYGKDLRAIKQINNWFSYFSATEQYRNICNRYRFSTNPIKRADRGVIAANVSPYDNIIKKYAAQLGWDWRLLAAVIYQESKFSINSSSHRGAKGLMQVMPQTGETYGIQDLMNPEQNIKAGTYHLKRLQRLYQNKGLNEEEICKFTLAAYNAGEGRIMDCRNLAASMNLDSNRWDNIVSIIPMMREDSILANDNVKLGKFQGHETIAYVDNVMELYKAICKIYPRS